MKLIALFIVSTMLAACAPRATSNTQNSVDPTKENGAQGSTFTLKDRSESNLTAVFQENMPKRLNAVYNNYLTQRPGFEGEIEARIVLLADGNVEKVEIANATTDYSEFEKAIADDLTQWKYDSGDYYKCTLKVPMKFLNENDNVQVKIENGLTVLKGRSSRKITEVFKQNTQTNSKKIYNEFLKKRPRFKGKIVVRITVIPSGDVEKVEIVSATTDYPEFEKAIVDDLMQWKYDSGNYVDCTFTIPLTFWED